MADCDGALPREGWTRYCRHNGGANYVYAGSHVVFLRWGHARFDQFPDHNVRSPFPDTPK